MTEVGTVVLALAAAGGAWCAWPAPLPLAVAVVAVALVGRWPAVLVLGAALLTSTLAARSWAGLHPPTDRPFDGVVTLVSDPASVGGETRVEVRVSTKRVEAWAHGAAARALTDRLAGERVAIAGRIEPLPARARGRLAARHIAARMSVDRVGAWTSGNAASRLANGVRRTLARGAESLSPSHRSLFLGFVLGDDRGQSPEVVDDFRASGLTHLLVVSGENLAFVLALVGPLLRRLAIPGRLAASAGVLIFFGLLTRWEPSVLRAVAMVSVSMLAWAAGRPSSTVRLLALAITGLLVVDPLLVHSVGFLLSVGACAGIAVLARPIADALPGPRPLADALGVTMAAQLGVAPVLVPVFGGVPVASLPANLLAVPAAGPVMMWGIAAGLPAGVVGGVLARAVCIPTGVLIGWIAGVARWSSSAPLGHLGLAHVVGLAALVLAGVVVRSRGGRLALVACAAVVLLQPAAALATGRPPWHTEPAAGADLYRWDGAAVLVVDTARPDQLLRGVHGAGVRTIDLLVVTRKSRMTTAAVGSLLARVRVRTVAGADNTPADGEVDVGSIAVRMQPAGATVEVRVDRR
jgi:competence protein ComEC